MASDFSSLSERIAAIGPTLILRSEALSALADAITSELDGLRIALIVTAKSGDIPQMAAFSNYAPSDIETYSQYFANINPWLKMYPSIKFARPTIAQDFVSHSDLIKTEFYTDWVRPQGEADDGFAVGFAAHENASAAMLVNHDIRRSDSDRRELQKVLSAAAQQIGGFLDFRLMTQAQDAARAGIMHGLAHPTWLLTQTSRVVDCNAAAEAEFRKGGMVRLSSGLIEVTATDAQEELTRAFAMLRSGTPASSLPPIRVPVPGGSSFALLRLVDAPSGADVGPLSHLIPGRVLATLIDLEASPHDVSLRARRLFGLTTAEAQVAAAIAEGETIAALADRRGCSRLTVRNQLRSAKEKIGVSRQVELARILQKLAPSL
jgi:DNA-binding CsgD family transcriptional regulator